MKSKQKKLQYKDFKPAIYALVFFAFLMSISFYYSSYKRGIWEKDVRGDLLEVLIGKKSKLEKALSSRIYYTKGVAAFVSIHPEISNDEFYELARQLQRSDSIISTMSLSKDGIINAIYPLEGHEAAIGLNLMEHPERREIVEKTIKTGKTFVAGPLILVEGGIGFISYTPIFKKETPGENHFWGMTDIVIDKNQLFEEAGLTTADNRFQFALKGTDGTGENGSTFWGSESIFANNPVKIKINLPDGNWVLAATPLNGWANLLDQDKTLYFALLLSSLLISLLFWLLLKAQLKVNANEKELKAILNSMHTLIVEYSDQGEYIKIPPTNKALLFRNETELIGKTVQDVFEPELAEKLMIAFQQCLETQELVIVEYPLEIQGTERWFSARISYKSTDRVILNAYEITEQKNIESNLRESEQRFKSLNGVKDKFLSILAHDLRGPVGSFKMLTSIMLSEFGKGDPEKTKRMLSSIHLASANLYDLLDNLLNWSHAQRDSIVISKTKIELFHLCDDAIDSQKVHADLKHIQIINEIPEDQIVFCDQYVTLTILRNLLSNAIKFTPNNGVVKMSTSKVETGDKLYDKISVQDSGVGMSEDQLESIFKLKLSESTVGTNNESGSGLGLSLCKEFIDKQGGRIEIDTVKSGGTTVSIYLPTEMNAKAITNAAKLISST
ncbi:ATP-binding protein [Mangrovibacterium sp.]|uniref:sensor histidine kinase n=1 Tax=Mangrovibacterium sp. TaxID=1961364 RepID=UPI003563896A